MNERKKCLDFYLFLIEWKNLSSKMANITGNVCWQENAIFLK